MRCERCGEETIGTTGSYFNTETICFQCSETEREHPLFDEAMRVELAAVESGDYNFPGIGLPPELIGGGR